jgi:hypothetical protein
MEEEEEEVGQGRSMQPLGVGREAPQWLGHSLIFPENQLVPMLLATI